MAIIERIDSLINNLTTLRPTLTDNVTDNIEKFENILQEAMNEAPLRSTLIKSDKTLEDPKNENIPSWVDPNYAYDPKNPRKPLMREMMKAISGKSVEELYATPSSNWEKISRLSSQTLYGVIGGNEDIRDWSTIMSSDDIISAANSETGKMYEPTVDIKTDTNPDTGTSQQYAVVIDKSGNVLSDLNANESVIFGALEKFGVKADAVPTDLEAKVTDNNFDINIFKILKNYSQNAISSEASNVQSASRTNLTDVYSEAVLTNLQDKIDLDQIEKL